MEMVGEPRVRIFGDVGVVTGRVTHTAFYESSSIGQPKIGARKSLYIQ
jgi:hypothetical protein